MTVMMITSNVTNSASSTVMMNTSMTSSIHGATVSATKQPLSESTIMPSVTTSSSTLTETYLYSDLSTPTVSSECPEEFCYGVQNIPLFISLFIIVIAAAVTALVCCIYWRRRLKPRYQRRHTLVQRPSGRRPEAPAIEERYTTIAGVEGQPRRECDDNNYAEVDEPAKKTQLGGGDNNHFYFILEGKNNFLWHPLILFAWWGIVIVLLGASSNGNFGNSHFSYQGCITICMYV